MSDKQKARQEKTRELIMEAALAEFSERGFQGARMENVAKRSGRNKGLVYRYFTDKEGLFRASMRHMFQNRENTRQQVPQNLGNALAYWFTETTQDPNFMRLIMQESLNDDAEKPCIDEAFRTAYYARQVESLKQMKEAGMVPEDFDASHLFVALTSLISWPIAFPQIVRMMTGKNPDDPTFIASYGAFLEQLGNQLAK